MRTFARRFRYATAWYVEGDFIILVGSLAPQPIDRAQQAIFFSSPDLDGKFSLATSNEGIRRLPPGRINTDDQPVIEFKNARNIITWRAGEADL